MKPFVNDEQSLYMMESMIDPASDISNLFQHSPSEHLEVLQAELEFNSKPLEKI
jgi:hypothetical protein